MNFDNSFVLFVHFLFLTKQNVKKCFMIYIWHSENLYTFQNANTTFNILKTVAKMCEKVLRLNMTSSTKVKGENFLSQFKSHITKQLSTSISVCVRIYLPLKVTFTSAVWPRVDKSSCLPLVYYQGHHSQKLYYIISCFKII